ncbi:PAS domain S-box-containing protein [Roseibium hamelinense]|uniref:histidine kinase n=1 Tax=Roseibium hamelinense TaxID=150831 RepID=A0A562TJ80_9HYPH|nr:PAS domain-containing protein [Roseibium hamelinense]MTI42054.1 PAS domain-containing protein [Roseibium hamelinense]TWI93328.1 PAS domain S-box-containing protein [Roseibium hamelinense]
MFRSAAHIWMQALDAAQVNITIADAAHPERPLTYVNRSFCETTGYAAEDVIGRSCRFLQGPGTCAETIAQIRQSLNEDQAIDVEILNYRRDGSEFWNALSLSPIRDETGRVTAIVGFQVDVTERRRLDEDRLHSAKMEALGRFSSGIAHEVNSMLQPIVSLPSLVKTALPEDKAEEREWLDLIEEHGKTARALLRKLLQYGRRNPAAEAALFDPCKALDAAAVHLRPACGDLINLVRNQTLATGKTVYGDLQSLVQSIIALGENAIDAMPQGGTLTLAAHLTDGTVSLSVQDTGPGVDTRYRHRIFEPFFTSKPIGLGTGLGLALAQSHITSMGGTISLKNHAANGACFTINLPLAEPDTAAPSPQFYTA